MIMWTFYDVSFRNWPQKIRSLVTFSMLMMGKVPIIMSEMVQISQSVLDLYTPCCLKTFTVSHSRRATRSWCPRCSSDVCPSSASSRVTYTSPPSRGPIPVSAPIWDAVTCPDSRFSLVRVALQPSRLMVSWCNWQGGFRHLRMLQTQNHDTRLPAGVL